MLNALFITHGDNGALLYEKVLLQELDDENLDLFNRFFAALKSFTSEIKVNGSKELKSVSLGDYSVKAANVPDFNIDVILVIDKEDQKIADKILPLILEIIREHKELFLETEYNAELFKIFDEQINSLILSSKAAIAETIIESQDNVFKSIWTQQGAISIKLRNNLVKEKEKITMRLQNENNYPNKLILLERLLKILEKLNEKEEFIEIQKDAEILREEIRDRKVKLSYYLSLTKEALKYKEYNKAYSTLYSFSYKLKNMAKVQVQEKYYMLATILSKKDKIPKIEFSQAVSEILISPDNIDEYLP